jgi:hypothetical protein
MIALIFSVNLIGASILQAALVGSASFIGIFGNMEMKYGGSNSYVVHFVLLSKTNFVTAKLSTTWFTSRARKTQIPLRS